MCVQYVVCVCVRVRVQTAQCIYTCIASRLQCNGDTNLLTAGITKAYLGISTHNAIMCAYTKVMP